MPPRTGVPTPGAMLGSQTSRSNETCRPSVSRPVSVQGALGDGRHAETVDVLHREHLGAGGDHVLAFGGVEVADADEDGAGGVDRRGHAADGRQLHGLGTQQRGEGHAVHVAAGAGVRRVHVAVRVDPEQAETLVALPGGGGAGGDGSGRQAVVAPEHQGQGARREGGGGRLEQAPADAGDVVDVLLAGISRVPGLADRRRQVAAVRHRVAQRGQAVAEAGDAQSRGAHVDPAPVGAQVQRHADDVHRLHRVPGGVSAAAAPAARPAATQSPMPTPRKAAPMICSPGVCASRRSISSTRAR